MRIHLRATAAPFAHDDGLSGETPKAHYDGMRKFQIYKDASDPAPFTVFDYGQDFVEAGYNDGDDTVVGTVPIPTLPAGKFTMGRVVHSHVRYDVAATVHASGFDLPGEFDNIQVMSNGTMLDGTLRDAGYYEYTFKAGGKSYTKKGTDAPEPVYESGGGFSVKFEDGEWASYFPMDLQVSPDVTKDVDMVMEVNMFESFRWQDQAEAGHTDGVFDVTTTSFEPVIRFGPNSFSVYSE